MCGPSPSQPCFLRILSHFSVGRAFIVIQQKVDPSMIGLTWGSEINLHFIARQLSRDSLGTLLESLTIPTRSLRQFPVAASFSPSSGVHCSFCSFPSPPSSLLWMWLFLHMAFMLSTLNLSLTWLLLSFCLSIALWTSFSQAFSPHPNLDLGFPPKLIFSFCKNT